MKTKEFNLFRSDGNYLREIKLRNRCLAVDFTKSGDIIVVVPRDDNKISLFTESGEFIKLLSVGFDGRIIACDRTNNKIRVISPDGLQLLQSFHASDCGRSLCCAVYHQGLVSDYDANCIKVFSKEGKFLYNNGSEGPGDGQLYHPVGLAFDKFNSLNNLIVCNRGNRRLQIFKVDGTFVSKIAEHFSKDNRIPTSVAVSNDGHVLATDASKDCVHVFQ